MVWIVNIGNRIPDRSASLLKTLIDLEQSTIGPIWALLVHVLVPFDSSLPKSTPFERPNLAQ